MRTTITLPDALFQQAKMQAVARHCTLAELVADALQRMLAATTTTLSQRPPSPLPTFKGKGLHPNVNLDSGADLLDVMEGRP